MFGPRSVLFGALCVAVVSVAGVPSSHAAPPGNGGCYQGGAMSGWLVPGTGSAGQNTHVEANAWLCDSPLLPNIDAVKITYEVPMGTQGPGWARFNWSDGSVSNANGGNNLWNLTDGPAAGHSIQLNILENSTTDMNGNTTGTDTLLSAIFMS